MTSRPQWIALSSVLFLCGCQTFDSIVPWRSSDKTHFTAEELAALDAQPIQPLPLSEDTSNLNGPAPIRPGGEIVQASYGPTAANEPVAAQRIDQLVKSGQSIVAQSQSDPVALQTASSYFSQALSLDANHSAAHHGLAIVADLTHDYPTAELHYKQALASNPNDANLLNDLGYSYILQHRFQDAANFLNRATQIAPQNKQPKVNLALLALKKGDRSEAQRVLAEVYPAESLATTLAELESRMTPAPAAPSGTVASTVSGPGFGPNDPGTAAQNVLQRVQQERERAEAERHQMAINQQPVHVFPPGIGPETHEPNVNPALITLPDGQQFQVTTPVHGNVHGGAAPTRTAGMPHAVASSGMGMSIPNNMQPANDYAAPVIQSFEDIRSRALANAPIVNPSYPQQANMPVNAVSVQAAPVAGLNAGPGALFPVAAMQRGPQIAPRARPQTIASPTGNAAGMPTNPPMANYGQTMPAHGPSAGYPSNASGSGTNIYQQQRLPDSNAPANSNYIPQGQPGGMPMTTTPLEAYERQLQSLDSQYNQAVQQMNGNSINVQAVPAQY